MVESCFLRLGAATTTLPVANKTAKNMDTPQSYLILFNISKKSNLGSIIRTANAFGVTEALIVGRRSYQEYGAFGTSAHTKKRHFYTLDDACNFLQQRNCSICGVEIVTGAVPIQSHPFSGSTAFMLGNEGTGLSEKQLEVCRQFVYIPQFGSGASLNVNVATAIVLHHFADWAGVKENSFQDGKFIQRTTNAR